MSSTPAPIAPRRPAPAPRPLRGAFRRLARNRDGSAAIEIAVTIPVLLTLFYCFFELCFAFYTHEMICEAAREGTRYAMVHGATCPNATKPTCEATASDVNNYVDNLPLPDIAGGTETVDTTYPDGNESPGSHVMVKVSYTFPITMPLVPTRSFTMTSTSEMTIAQ